MPSKSTETSYGSITRTFHWLTALLIIAAFPLGVVANNLPFDTAEAAALKTQVFSLHKTLGIAAFTVATLRILWALTQKRPVPLHPNRKLETFAAETVHWALYLSMVVVPLSGWIHHAAVEGFAPILWPFGQGLPFVPKSETVAVTASSVHWLFTKVLLAAIALHIAGALKHVFIDRDLTMARMTKGVSAGTVQAQHSALPFLAALAIFAIGAVGAWQLASRAISAAEAPAAETAVAPTTGNWQVVEGTLGFSVQQMGAEIQGMLPAWTADITFDETTGSGNVVVNIDMSRMSIGSVTEQAKGSEFFDVAKHPTAVFKADISPTASGHEAKGTLTLRGTEMPLTLPFELQIAGDTAEMSGTVMLDRRDFGMGPSYPDEATVGFSVTVSAKLTAKRAE